MDETSELKPRPLSQRVAGLGLARGTIVDALITAAVRAVLFIIVPLLIISLIQASNSDPGVQSGLQEVRNSVLVVGTVLVAISFAWAYHLRSSKARLMFGIIGAGLLVIYAYAVFMIGGFADAMSGLGWKLPGVLLFGIGCYLALASAMIFVRDYAFFRAERTRDKEAVTAFKPSLGRGEFDRRLGSYSLAASTVNKFVRRTMVRWAFVLLMFLWLMSLIGFGRNPAESGYLDILANMVGIILLLGVPMVLLSWFKGFFPKGTVSRTAFDVALSLTMVLTILLIFTQSGLLTAARSTGVDFPILPIIIALVLWAVIDVLRALGEYGDERRAWKMKMGYEVKKKKKTRQVPSASLVSEFDPSLGKMSRGLVSAQKTFFRSVTLPVIFVVLALGGARAAGLDTGPLFSAMVDVVYLLPWLGLVLTLISFGRGYYPPGSLSRMLVGLLLVPGLFLYVFNTFITTPVEDACRRAGLIIPFNLVVALVVVSILFVGFLQVTEMIDARRAWLQVTGRETKPLKPIEKMTRWQEFRLRFGSAYEATRWARKGMIRYLYYTTIMIIVLLTIIESTNYSIGGLDLTRLDTRLRETYITIILLAVPLAAVRSAYGFYPAGSTSKLAMGLFMCLVGALYTYLALQGGQLVRGGDFGAEQVGLVIDFTFIVNAFLFGWLLYAITIMLEYRAYRREWVANDYHPVASKEVQANLRQQKLMEKERRRAQKASREGLSLSEVEDSESLDSESEVEEELRREIGNNVLQATKEAKVKGAGQKRSAR